MQCIRAASRTDIQPSILLRPIRHPGPAGAACWSTGRPRLCFGMVRRRRPADPLLPLQQPTWLVVRNKHRQPLEWREVEPGVDLRALLEAARAERMVAGWTCDAIGYVCSFFFPMRDGERIQVTVERCGPAGPGHPSIAADTLKTRSCN